MHSRHRLDTDNTSTKVDRSSPALLMTLNSNTRSNRRSLASHEVREYYNQADEMSSLESGATSPRSPQTQVGGLSSLELIENRCRRHPQVARPESDHYDCLPVLGSLSGHGDIEPMNYERNSYAAFQTKATTLGLKQISRKHKIMVVLVTLAIACVFLASVLVAFSLICHRIEISMESKLSVIQSNILNIYPRRRGLNHSTLIAGLGTYSPELLVKFDNTCYCVYRNKLSWFESRDFCVGLGADVHLAEIKSAATNTYLRLHLLALFRTPHSVWLGASDVVTSGVWLWNSTRTSLETFTPSQWKEGQPVKESTSTCVRDEGTKRKTFRWNTGGCTLRYAYMCQSPEVSEKCRC